jgi:hypothetical protein
MNRIREERTFWQIINNTLPVLIVIISGIIWSFFEESQFKTRIMKTLYKRKSSIVVLTYLTCAAGDDNSQTVTFRRAETSFSPNPIMLNAVELSERS